MFEPQCNARTLSIVGCVSFLGAVQEGPFDTNRRFSTLSTDLALFCNSGEWQCS
jgi:hypothetical protein